MRTELTTQFDSKKSFYKKAYVELDSDNNTTTLYSYNTKVAYIDLDTKKAVVLMTYSATTLRHIKEFLKQNGFKAETSKQIENDYEN